MQALLLALKLKVGAAAHAVGAEGHPLLQDLPHAHHPGLAAHQHVEVAGKAVLHGGGAVELLHELVRVLAALQVDGQLQAVQVGLVPHVADFFDAAGLHQIGDLIHDGLHRGGGGNLRHLNAVALFFIAVHGAHLDAAPALLVHLFHLGCVVQNLAAAGEIRGGQRHRQIGVLILHQGHGGLAQLRQVERADVGGHAHGNAQGVVGQNGGEGHGQ